MADLEDRILRQNVPGRWSSLDDRNDVRNDDPDALWHSSDEEGDSTSKSLSEEKEMIKRNPCNSLHTHTVQWVNGNAISLLTNVTLHAHAPVERHQKGSEAEGRKPKTPSLPKNEKISQNAPFQSILGLFFGEKAFPIRF